MKMEQTASRSMVNDVFIDLLLLTEDIGTFVIAFFHIVFKDIWIYLRA